MTVDVKDDDQPVGADRRPAQAPPALSPAPLNDCDSEVLAARSGDGIRSVRAVERALDLLSVLEASGRPMRLTDVARVTGMHKATTQRLLNVLERRRFIQKVRGMYQVGVASLPLSHAFLMGNGLTRASLPVLQELARGSGETITLFVRLGFSRVAVQRVESVQTPRYSLPIGERLPLHLGAGRVLAAAMNPAGLAQMLAGLGEIRVASGEVLEKQALLADIERVREQGYCVALCQRNLSAASVSAPVIGSDGQTLAAVCITLDPERMTQEKTRLLILQVQQAAQAIAASVAYS